MSRSLGTNTKQAVIAQVQRGVFVMKVETCSMYSVVKQDQTLHFFLPFSPYLSHVHVSDQIDADNLYSVIFV